VLPFLMKSDIAYSVMLFAFLARRCQKSQWPQRFERIDWFFALFAFFAVFASKLSRPAAPKRPRFHEERRFAIEGITRRV
jgi:hypothetical protein